MMSSLYKKVFAGYLEGPAIENLPVVYNEVKDVREIEVVEPEIIS